MKWDIFCAVVDNYGDIGVTWRLARQLVAEHGLNVRLWVDDLRAFAHICPSIDEQQSLQWQAGVEVHHWPQQWPAEIEAADRVIEAFACNLPEPYIAAMAARTTPALWLNLEYLSAEQWVAGCHGLPSPQGGGLQKYFFFPGFEPATGGLLRERALLSQRTALQADSAAQAHFLATLGVVRPACSRLFSLFTYENQTLASWLTALSDAAQATHLLVPQGRVLAGVEAWLGQGVFELGRVYQCGALSLQALPFMPQDDYDRLLWCCDFNAVRGEDSFVRAQWAARPMLWHIYVQEQEAHLEKLEAFLALYCAGLEPAVAEATAQLWRAWNGAGDFVHAWAAIEAHWPQVRQHAQRWALQQAEQPDLAAALVQFQQNWI